MIALAPIAPDEYVRDVLPHSRALWAGARSFDEMYRLLSSIDDQPSRAIVGGSEPGSWFTAQIADVNQSLDPLDRMTFSDSLRYLTDDLLQKVDRAASESLRCRQLSPAQVDVLATVGSSDGISQQELADTLLVTKGNVCQLLDKMETSGLLERRPDKRVNRLFLTDQGRQVYEEVVPRHDALLAEQFRSLSDPDQRELGAKIADGRPDTRDGERIHDLKQRLRRGGVAPVGVVLGGAGSRLSRTASRRGGRCVVRFVNASAERISTFGALNPRAMRPPSGEIARQLTSFNSFASTLIGVPEGS